MNITLQRIGIEEAWDILIMQRQAYKYSYRKYNEISPIKETLEDIKNKFRQKSTYYYYIKLDDTIVGVIRVIDNKDGKVKSIDPIFILYKYRNNGIAQNAVHLIEQIHGQYNWKLNTVLQEKSNCYLFEKLGYRKTGETKVINDSTTLVYYIK